MMRSHTGAALFGLLGSMYLCKPTKEALAGWRTLLGHDPPLIVRELKEALERIDVASAPELEALLWEYTRLFVGPYRLPCPPWESVYTSPKKLLMQEAYDTVKAMYAQVGVEVGDPNTLADHIGAELNFMAILLEKAETESELGARYRQLAEEFWHEHLWNWIPEFTSDLEEAADTTLYKVLAQTTRRVVQSPDESGDGLCPFGKLASGRSWARPL